MKNVFIIGSKGIPANYGGFESFVEQLTARQENKSIHYYIACRNDLSKNKQSVFEYNGATCFNVKVPNLGPARAILYDVLAFKQALQIIRDKNISRPIIYVLACRMGPFIKHFKKELAKFDGTLFVNPDGHEWLRAKWSYPVRVYWKVSERLMVKNADLLICDSQNIEQYIHDSYKKYYPKTTYIAYGSDVKKSTLASDDLRVKKWYSQHGVKIGQYYLIVGRFVPENNYETMIKEFMQSNTKRDLVIISNVEKNSFYNHLLKTTGFDSDDRIKFVGTVYDAEMLKFIRENAFAYIHGHEVGGTNPSLLEALASTKVNLLLNVGFNREVGGNGALYWDKDKLSVLLGRSEHLDIDQINQLNEKSSSRIQNYFSWGKIVSEYEKQFIEDVR
ncbi:beta 1-4 rhamnosyltransferase Cps2T [Lactiplantibacillus carotarum]|uniref:beta 1-4 rhamnosyltransferase Cps2T n=1 Tax=Lactiplantibacillus carotarum TaxID=2993456 RepID=UPI00298F24F6|nr:glycosyltransferase family 1 protein [Lactiplantibacillus carotarum]